MTLNQTTVGTAPQHLKCLLSTAGRSQIQTMGREDRREDTCYNYWKKCDFATYRAKADLWQEQHAPATPTQATPNSYLFSWWIKWQLNRLQGIARWGMCCRSPDCLLSSRVNGIEQIQSTSTAYGGSGHRLTKGSKAEVRWPGSS